MVSLYVIQTAILQWATLGQNKLQSLLGFMLIVKCLGTWYLVLFPTYFPLITLLCCIMYSFTSVICLHIWISLYCMCLSSGLWRWCSGVRRAGGGFAVVCDPRAVCGHPGLSSELPPSSRWNHRFVLGPYCCLPPRQLQTSTTGWDIRVSSPFFSFIFHSHSFSHTYTPSINSMYVKF